MVGQLEAVSSTLLQEAVSHAFREGKNRLAHERGWNADQLRLGLQRASDDLDKLRSYESPNYALDEVALIYLLRYQFSHANLAWSMLAGSDMSARIERNGPIPRLHIVDLGAGSFALLLGLTLFLAELIERQIAPDKVTLLSVEPSQAMRKLGDVSWQALQAVASDRHRLTYEHLEAVRSAIARIDHRHADIQAIAGIRDDLGAIRMLTAMHAVYKDQQRLNALRASLAQAHDRLRPHCGFMTAHGGHSDRMRSISPFNTEGRPLDPKPKLNNDVNLLARQGELAQFTRFGRSRYGIDHAFGWWDKQTADTCVLYWANDLQAR